MLVAGLLALSLVAAACGGGDDTDPGTEPTTGSSTTTTEDPTDDTGPDDGGPDETGTTRPELLPESTKPEETPDQTGPPPGGGEDAAATGDPATDLRRRLGATKVVVRTADALISDAGDARFDLPADYATAYPHHLVLGRRILDDAGDAACPDLDLLGDFTVVADIVSNGGDATVVVVENRRALVEEAGPGLADIDRWGHDCASGETTELEPTATAAWDGDRVIERRLTTSGVVLHSEWGLGDSPLILRTDTGTVLIDGDDLAYDHVVSPDGETIYFTSYAGTGAALPPVAVTAVDSASGEVRWRLDEPGFAFVFGDRVVIQLIDPSGLDDLGLFPGRGIVVLDAATGAELDRFAFDAQLVGLF